MRDPDASRRGRDHANFSGPFPKAATALLFGLGLSAHPWPSQASPCLGKIFIGGTVGSAAGAASIAGGIGNTVSIIDGERASPVWTFLSLFSGMAAVTLGAYWLTLDDECAAGAESIPFFATAGIDFVLAIWGILLPEPSDALVFEVAPAMFPDAAGGVAAGGQLRFGFSEL